MLAPDWLPFLGLLALGIGMACFYKCIADLRAGLYLLVITVFFGGIVGANLGNTGFPVVFRDIFIVLPLYIGMALSRGGGASIGLIPADVNMAIGLFLGSILLALMNPDLSSATQLAIGLKVWLYYVPFLAIGVATATRPGLMISFFRAILVIGGIACAVGLVQSLLVRAVGYETTMGWFFGAYAENVTQNFTVFEEAGGIYRIPGTFSFVGQYGQFLVLYLTVAVILANSDPDGQVRRAALWMAAVAVLAAVLSGARTTIIAVPAILVVYAFSGLLTARVAFFLPVAIAGGSVIIAYSGLELVRYFYFGVDLAREYGGDFIFQQIFSGLDHGFLGSGIGTSTGAARFAMSATQADSFIGYESWLGKTAAELGWFGFSAVCLMLAVILLRALATFVRNRRSPKNAVIAPLVAYVGYMLVLSFKGSVLDFDPGNIFFWLFLGLMLGTDAIQDAFHEDDIEILSPSDGMAGYTRAEQGGG